MRNLENIDNVYDAFNLIDDGTPEAEAIRNFLIYNAEATRPEDLKTWVMDIAERINELIMLADGDL